MGSSRTLWLWFAALAVYAGLTLFHLASSDLQTDEGRFGVSGLNILADYHQLATVSEDPLGGPGTKPFMYPVLIAGSIAAFGKGEFAVRFVNVGLILLAAIALYKLARILIGDEVCAGLAACLFLFNPASLTYARMATPEPAVVFFGLLGCYFCARFCRSGGTRWALLCGAALGLAFLSKLWLVLPFGLACLGLFALRFIEQKTARSGLIPFAAFLVFLCVASSHLLLAAWLAPSELGYWRGLYFGTTLGNRVHGAASFDPAMWLKPWWFYAAAFFKGSFFGLPFVLSGAARLYRPRARQAAIFVAALLLMLPVLSLFAVKEAVYLFPIFPAIALLLALGLIHFWLEADAREIAACALLSAILAIWFSAKGVLGSRDLIATEALYAIYGVAATFRGDQGLMLRRIAAGAMALAMVFTSAVAIRRDMRHRTYYREVARYFSAEAKPFLPAEVIFRAPEYASMEFYLFRSGEYWRTYLFSTDVASFERNLAAGKYLFCIVDPRGALYGGGPSPTEGALLKADAVDITADVERSAGHAIPVRVLVPRKSAELAGLDASSPK